MGVSALLLAELVDAPGPAGLMTRLEAAGSTPQQPSLQQQPQQRLASTRPGALLRPATGEALLSDQGWTLPPFKQATRAYTYAGHTGPTYVH